MRNKYLFVLLACFFLSANAYAGGYALAKKHMCTACHSLDKKSMGPSWMSISIRYQSDPKAESYLFDKIRYGGAGVWGDAVMPPSNSVDEADIRVLAHYIMGLVKE